MGLARGKGTDEPHLSSILMAQAINRIMGGALVTPWNLNDLPDDWLDAFSALAYDLPEMRAGQSKVDAALAKLRKPKNG